MTCPNCRECPFERGVCERLANRSRRFFLMGALALPVAAKIARVAPVDVPKFTVSTARASINGRVWEWEQAVAQKPDELREMFNVDFKAWALAI